MAQIPPVRLARLRRENSRHYLQTITAREGAKNEQRPKDRNIFIVSTDTTICANIQLRATPPAKKACQRALEASFAYPDK
jgi:hypothetical protein